MEKPKYLYNFAVDKNVEMIKEYKVEENSTLQKLKEPVAEYSAPSEPSHTVMTPALARKIKKARQDYAEGRTTECRTKKELSDFLEAL